MFLVIVAFICIFFGYQLDPTFVAYYPFIYLSPLISGAILLLVHGILSMVGLVDIQDEKSPPVVVFGWIITGFDSLYKKITGFILLYMQEYLIGLAFSLLHAEPLRNNPEILALFGYGIGTVGLGCLIAYFFVSLRKKTMVSAY